MSILIYGDIQLDLLKTNSVDRIARLSEDETTYLWTDFIINVTAVYSPSFLATGGGEMPPVTDFDIRHALMQPRLPLRFEEGGIPILDIPGNPGEWGPTIDAENGPIPQSCTINRIIGVRLWYVSYVIKASIIECPSGTEVSVLAASRYTRTETIDEQYRSTMIVNGFATFRSNVLAFLGNNPDAFRGFLIPPQLLGYKRQNIQFTVQESGTAISFTCIDVEQFENIGDINRVSTPASVGITELDLRYTTSATQWGAQGFSAAIPTMTVTVQAKARRDAVNINVVIMMMGLARNKLNEWFDKGVFMNGRVSEDMFRKEFLVEMSFFTITEKALGGIDPATAISVLKLPLRGIIGKGDQLLVNLPNDGINPQPPFSNGTRGTAGYQLAVAAFAQACFSDIADAGIDETATVIPPDAYTPGQSYGNGPTVQALPPPPPLPDTPNKRQPYSPDGGERVPSWGKTGASAYPEWNIRYDDLTNIGITPACIATPIGGSLGTGSLGGPSTSAASGSSSGPWDQSWYDQQPSNVCLRLFLPMTRRRIEWSIVRVGAVPEAPSAIPIDDLKDQYTLISRVVSPINIELAPDCATLVYRLSGVYTYVLTDPERDDAKIPFPIPPWVAVKPSDVTQMQDGDYLKIANGPVV